MHKIIGGHHALHAIPWQVSIKRSLKNNTHICGGTILDPSTILSAAHCFAAYQEQIDNGLIMYIMAGSIDRDSKEGQVSMKSCLGSVFAHILVLFRTFNALFGLFFDPFPNLNWFFLDSVFWSL